MTLARGVITGALASLIGPAVLIAYFLSGKPGGTALSNAQSIAFEAVSSAMSFFPIAFLAVGLIGAPLWLLLTRAGAGPVVHVIVFTVAGAAVAALATAVLEPEWQAVEFGLPVGAAIGMVWTLLNLSEFRRSHQNG